MPLTKAERVEDIYKAFDPAPLSKPAEIADFYVREINDIRGSDKIKVLALGLKRQYKRGVYKAFVMGHSGVGISTELSRLQIEVASQFRTLRLSANTDLDPVNFKPFDVILRIALGLAEETAKPLNEGGAGTPLPDELTRELLDWFATEKNTIKLGYAVAAKADLTIKPPVSDFWKELLGLNASLKLEAKRASGRTKELIEYREKNVGQLMDLANKVLNDCNKRLRDASGHEWLIIGDDFDKPGIPEDRITDFFLVYGNILSDLACHLILDLPIGLGHSSRSNQLPALFDRPCNFPDTPVYQKDHTPHESGRAALRQVIAQRMNPDLFAEEQQERLIVASGGNLRDLFSLIVAASTNAELRESNNVKITKPDVDAAINDLRKEYRDHLGETSYDIEKPTFGAKLSKLAAVYLGKPEAELHDPALYSLLHARAVQEFNGVSWFGVHPLIVDFLSRLDGPPELAAFRDSDTKRLSGGSI